MKYFDVAMSVINNEIKCLEKMKDSFDSGFDDFIAELDDCRGKIIFSGMGKSGHICKKIVATMNSLGIKSLFLHPAEAVHGDLGVVSKNDIIIAVSNSGETKEVLDLIPPLKHIGAKLFCIVGRENSSLEHNSERTLVIKGLKEVFLDMVPTSSTTCALVIGDAIAVSIAKRRKFSSDDFGLLHPSGQLGKRLTLRVKDIMIKDSENSIVLEGSTLEQAIFEMCRKPVGGVSVVDKNGKLKGIFTDGDLKRHFNKKIGDVDKTMVDDIMVRCPITIDEDDLVYDVICNVVSKHSVPMYPVINGEGKSVGTLRMIDIIKSGMVS